MQTYVALLRGINLGARNKVSMADLRELFAALGAEDVQTYVQSGNVVFRSSESAAVSSKAIEKGLSSSLGISARVILRSRAQLARIEAGNPFAAAQPEPTKLHVTFLDETPARARVRELDGAQFAPDEFRVAGTEVYLHCPHGYGRSKLSNAFFEKHLGVDATTRNWRTVTKLAELSSK